ncbi:MAG: hypothetical protein V4591_04250 [Bdellovibrionota bacterium]
MHLQDNLEQNRPQLTGNILLFYAFDVGDEIDLETIKQNALVETCVVPLSPYFKNYHLPLSFKLGGEPAALRAQCVSSKIYSFGVLSFCYQIPFQESFEDLKLKIIDIKKYFDEKSEKDARRVFNKIHPAIKKSVFHNVNHAYFVVQVYPVPQKISSDEFKELYGSKIASLLKLEIYTLSDYQKDEILTATIGYYGQDFMIIDSAGSFIYDETYSDSLEFFESANIQKLELQYFDRTLDEKLTIYSQQKYKIPFSAYIPLLGNDIYSPISRLAKLRVDISVITERLENSIKLAGDTYYSKLYSLLVEKMSLKEWRDSLNRKLEIMRDLYQVHQNRLDTIHEEELTVVIIILIALEAIIAFFR